MLKFSLRIKISIAAIILCLVTITSGVINYRFINNVSENSLQVINVEIPLEEAFLGMEIGLSETTRATLDYIQDYQEKHVINLDTYEKEYEINVEKFFSYCETDEEKIACEEVSQLFSEYMGLSREIISLQNMQSCNDARFDLA